jgi:hypothetical protein
LAANSVDSDQYVDGSIDNAHLADDAVDSDELAAGSVDIAHLSATGTAGSGNYLRGDNSWQSAGGGKLVQIVAAQSTTSTTITGPGHVAQGGTWRTTGLTCAITPTSSTNKIHATFSGVVGGTTQGASGGKGTTACAIGLSGLDSGSGFDYDTLVSTAAFTLIHPHTYNELQGAPGYLGWYWDCTLHGLTVAGTTSEITYEVYFAPIYGVDCQTRWGAGTSSRVKGPGHLILMEIES